MILVLKGSIAWNSFKRKSRSTVATLATLILLHGVSIASEVTIGAPYQNNLQKKVFIENPDDPSLAKEMRRFQYQISCTYKPGASDTIYKSVSPLVRNHDEHVALKGASLGVIYFVSDKKRQFIYGTLADSKGRSSGKKIFVRSEDWNCQLFNTQQK